MSKREERALTVGEKFRLYLHLLVCEFCRRFLKQSKIISKEAKRLTSSELLTVVEKQKMKELLNLT